MMRKLIIRLSIITVFLVIGGLYVLADIVPGTVSSDPFDSSQGTVVVNHDTIIDPINAFRTSGDFENGHTLMRNGGLNSMSFIEFDTASLVEIVGVRLFAHNDKAGCCLRRAMSHFRLLADTDNDSIFETTVVDVAINPDYDFQPGNNATGVGDLDLTLFASGIIMAQHWRLEVTQGTDVQPFEGARLVEVDALPAVDIDIKPGSAPNSINCKNKKGVIPVAILTTEDFDATTVDHTTVIFEGASETHVDKKSGEPRRHKEDVDDDGDTDLVFHFRSGDTNLTCESEEGILTGETFDGQVIKGKDAIRMVGNN